MKKFKRLSVILLALMMVGSLVAQDYDDDAPAPRRSRRGWSPLNQTLCVGLFASYHLSVTQEEDGTEVSSSDLNEKYGGFGAKIYPFLGGKLGVGIDFMLLDSEETESWWLVDFELLARFQLTRRMTVNGGIGYSQFLYVYEDGLGESQSEWGKTGVNVKLGVEYFFSKSISVSGDWKWIMFDLDFNGHEYTFKYFTFQLGVNFWL